jgi:hypothetical protein
MYPKLLARDLGILTVSALAWWLAAPLSAGSGALSDIAGVLLGALFGASAFLVHEWGHLVGALATRSAIQAPAALTSPFVFTFESRKNTRRQFLAMSLTGFAATAVVIWIVYLLPDAWLASRVARGLVLFLTLLTIVLEVPLVVYSLVTNKVPPVDGLEARREAQRTAA